VYSFLRNRVSELQDQTAQQQSVSHYKSMPNQQATTLFVLIKFYLFILIHQPAHIAHTCITFDEQYTLVKWPTEG